jgi:glycosyltransferase involved in cell wall biosynthesis
MVADVSVLCLVKPENHLPSGLEVIFVPQFKYFRTDKALYLIYALFFHAMQRFDHIFIFGTNFSILVPLLKAVFWRRAKIHLRSGSVDHEFAKWSGPMRIFMRLSERMCRFADTIIAVSPNIKRHLSNLNIEATLVRNGLDRRLDKQSLGVRRQRSVLAVGRITTPKNYALLIEASQLMGASGPDITIIGGADPSDEAQRLKALLRLKPLAKVHFIGAMERSFVIQRFDLNGLYVNCSTNEGMSNAVLEAIQQGIPLILSDIESNRDLGLRDHFYFDPHDAQALAQKIEDALLRPEDYVAPVDLFEDWDKVIGRILMITCIGSEKEMFQKASIDISNITARKS